MIFFVVRRFQNPLVSLRTLRSLFLSAAQLLGIGKTLFLEDYWLGDELLCSFILVILDKVIVIVAQPMSSYLLGFSQALFDRKTLD